GGHTDEQQGQEVGHRFQLRQFLVEVAMRELFIAPVGTQCTPGLEQLISSVNDGSLAGARCEPQYHVVEGSLHVEGSFQHRAVQPQDGVAREVGEQVSGADLVDVLRRYRRTADQQLLVTPVDDHGQPVTRLQLPGFSKGLADHDFVLAAGSGKLAALQVEAVQDRLFSVGNGNG